MVQNTRWRTNEQIISTKNKILSTRIMWSNGVESVHLTKHQIIIKNAR